MGGDELIVHNIYIPPASSCEAGHAPSLDHFLRHPTENCLVLGDLNAHHSVWCSGVEEDFRGAAFMDEIDLSTFVVLNDLSPTRLPSHGNPSSPDVSIASASIATTAVWRAHAALSSDHLPIVIDLGLSTPPTTSPCRSYINLRKANWPAFRDSIEAEVARCPPPSTVESGERRLRDILLNASRKHIPAGKYSNVRPGFPADAARIADRRDQLRTIDPTDPEIARLNGEISTITKDYHRQKWREYLSKIDRRFGTKRLWGAIRSLTRPRPPDNEAAIDFHGKIKYNRNRIADRFCRQYTAHRPQ